MSWTRIDRQVQLGRRGRTSTWTHAAHLLVTIAMVVALTPHSAHAQFGRLKQLKQKFSAPDSAARAKDSLAQIAAGVKPESVKVGRSFLQKSASVVSSANGALESATGISAKDAALAATGVGAGNLMAKKLGMDPMSIASQAIANAKMSAQQRSMQKVGGADATGVGMPSAGMMGAGMDAAQLQAMQRAAMANSAAASRGNSAALGAMGGTGMEGFTQADAEALVAFQQEMMRLSMAASAGDASARARLESWQTMALKYQNDMQKLSIAASGGDMAAAQKMQRMQLDLVREWVRSGNKARLPKGAHR